MNTIQKHVISKDGTTIAFDQSGKGSALILVGGAFEQRAMDSETAQLAALPLLSQHFTVIHYDRRGRGDSTDTLPFAVEREIEDISALIDEVGGSAFVFGISSGAALAMEAAINLGDKIKKLAMYEPPYNNDKDFGQALRDFRTRHKEAIAEGRRGDAVAHFLTFMGAGDHLDHIRQLPMWPMWEAIAPTFAYDAAALGEDGSIPSEKAARVTMPTLIMDGELSYPFMHIAATTLGKALPNAQHRTLAGQTHEVKVEVIGPILVEFFNPDAANV
jgi:pimeloyl-ACP methyl ester carboxylesterase